MSVKADVAFLFDLDGVLIDSERTYTRIWEKIEEDYPSGVANFTTRIKGTTLENILTNYFPAPQVRAHVEDLLYKLEAEMRYEYCEGAHELLEKLKLRDIPMALVTSSNKRKMDHLYRDIPGIRSYFVDIIDDEKVTRSKPDPQGYLLGAEAAGVAPRYCAVVEDSLQGVRAGRAAGAYVIGVAGTLPKETLQGECDLLIEHLTEIDVDKVMEILRNR